MKRKILSILLCIAMIASLFSNVGIVFATDVFDLGDLQDALENGDSNITLENNIDLNAVTGLSGEGTAESPYLIGTLDELKWFRDDVNAGNTYSGKYVKLTADINLGNEEWTPIGNATNLFQGNFDGGEKVISNLTINGEKNYYNNPDYNVGLFGYIKNGGYIKNVTIENVQVTGCLYVGAVIGHVYIGGVVENCHVKGDIDIEGYWYVGGVVGRYDYGSGVKNCSVAGTTDNIAVIEADYNAETNADEDGSYVGGILGFTTEPNPVVTIANNSVSYVNIYGVTRIGGISGIAHYGNIFSDNTVSNTNIYAIQSDTDAIDADTLGLIAGACQGTDENPVTFTNCTATDTTVYLNGEVIAVGEYGGTIGEQDPITNYVAGVDGVQYTDLQTAFSALTENSTLTLLANVAYDELTEIKMPATLKNVTINGNGKTIKNAKIMAADGSTLDYDGLTFKNIVFDNTNIVITGWRASASFKNIAVVGCTFKNIVRDSANEAALHINVDEDEAINGFTFTNNIIDGVSGSSNSGVYMAGTGTITFTDNVINNVAFRPILLQLADCDGVTDEVIISNNTFSGSAKGRLQVYGTEIDNGDGTYTPSGTDELTVNITENIFKDITSTQQICTWGLNTENYDISHNYYDIDITENPSKIFWNNITPSDPEGLVELGIYPVYTELNEDGTINTESEYTYVPTVDLPTATVTDITKEELDSKNAPALTFAKKFTADTVDEPVAEFYGDWYADFVLTLNKEATFNANGNADGYLAGQYDEFGENWLSVPFEDVTLKAGESLKIMEYAAKLLNQPGLKITYNDVLTAVKVFNCGIFFTPEYLAENPDLEITLELRIYDNNDETVSYSIGDNFEFDAPMIIASVDGVGYETLEEVMAAVTENSTIKLFENIALPATITIPSGVNLTLDLNGKNITVAYNEETGKSLYAIDNYGTFTLTDTAVNGTITARGINNFGTMTMAGGTIVSCDANGGAAIWNVGTLEMTGGLLKATYQGTSNDDFGPGALNNSGTATISNGVLDSVNLRAYAIISSGVLNILGDKVTVNSGHGALAISGGTALIEGGTFNTIYSIGESDHALYVNGGEVTVKGGTFDGRCYAICVNSGNATVEDGSFTAEYMSVYVEESANLAINGGTYSDNTGADYVKEGFELAENEDGTYGVVEAEEEEKLEGGVFYINNMPLDENGKYQVGIYHGIDSLNYKEVGFELYNGSTGSFVASYSTRVVYSSLKVTQTDGSVVVKTAEEMNSFRMFGITAHFSKAWDNIPVHFRAYAIDLDGNKIYGTMYSIPDIYTK